MELRNQGRQAARVPRPEHREKRHAQREFQRFAEALPQISVENWPAHSERELPLHYAGERNT